MKKLTRIYIPMVFGLFLMLSSCDGDSSITNKESGAETSYGAEELVEAAPVFTNCDCAALPGTKYQISAACARCLEQNYKTNGSKFPDTANGPVRGFEVAYGELKEIVGDGSGAKVFTMLGIKATANGSGGQTIESDIFHQVQLTGTDNVVTNTYYDFTQPCPDFCP